MPPYQTFAAHFKKLFDTQSKRRLLACALLVLGLFFFIRNFHSTAIDVTYRVAYDAYWEQINLMGKERNVSAFSKDVLAAIAKEEGKRVNLIQIPSAKELYRGLRTGEFDGILSSLTPTIINRTTMLFSEPYFLLGSVLVTRARAPTSGWNELGRKIIGVQANSPSILQLEKDSTIQIKVYDDILTALSDLDKGIVDGVLFPALQAHVYATTFFAGKLKIATSPLTEEGLRLIAPKTPKGEQLIAAFNEGLKIIKTDDTYDNLLHKWGLVNPEKLEDINGTPKEKPAEPSSLPATEQLT